MLKISKEINKQYHQQKEYKTKQKIYLSDINPNVLEISRGVFHTMPLNDKFLIPFPLLCNSAIKRAWLIKEFRKLVHV